MKVGIGLDTLLRCFLLSLIIVCVNGCGGDETERITIKPDPIPVFDAEALVLTDVELIKGREIWLPKCGMCHISGLGGAPKIGDKSAWAPRIAQGKDTLYAHAINGFIGPQYNEMPAKGGFVELSDDEVKLAVDFVVFASE